MRRMQMGSTALLLAALSGCTPWAHVAHDVAPESVSDPAHEFEVLVLTGVYPPVAVAVEAEFATLTNYFGANVITFSRMAALEIRSKGGRYLVDVFDRDDYRMVRLEQPSLASARRLCDVLSALHARALGPADTSPEHVR